MSNFTAGYDCLKRLFHKVNGNNWQDKIQKLAQSSQGSNLLEIRTLVKGLCEEIAQHARVVNDDHTRKMLFDFLSCVAHSSASLEKNLSEIHTLKDRNKKHQALLQLLLSEELQHLLTEQLKSYLCNDAVQSPTSAHTFRALYKALEQRIARCMDDIAVTNNQASYDATGRIVKRIMDLLTLLLDVLLINLGMPPAFSEDNKDESGRKPQTIMPMPMKM